MERAGCAAGDAARRSRGKCAKWRICLRGACAVSLVSSRPGGVGAPPGDTTIPRQELADVDVRSFRPVWKLALEWADTVRASVEEQTHDPRQARPDAVNLLPDWPPDVATRGAA